MLALPPVLQRDGHDCGLAAVRCVAAYHGYAVRKPVGWPCQIDGTDPRILEPYLRANGYGVQSGEMEVGDLRHHAKKGRPVLCLVQRGGVGHWVVSAGVGRNRVYYMDPASGQASEPVAGFWGRWRDVCRDGTNFRGWGIAVRVL